MIDIRSDLKNIANKFGSFVTKEYNDASASLQNEISGVVTDIVENVMRPTMANYILKYGQKGFDKAVSQDKDMLSMIRKYRPSYLWYVRRARSVKRYIKWNPDLFVENLAAFLGEHDIYVNDKAREWLARNVESFRKEIYGI